MRWMRVEPATTISAATKRAIWPPVLVNMADMMRGLTAT